MLNKFIFEALLQDDIIRLVWRKNIFHRGVFLMILIADNLNTRNKEYMAALAAGDSGAISGMSRQLKQADADIINLQCSLDGAGDEDKLPWVAEVVEKASDAALGLDSRNIEAIRKALAVAKKPCLINYVSGTEPEARQELFELARRAKAYVVLRASAGSIPVTFEAKMQILEELLEDANRADIPNERIFMDPSLIHIARGGGQDHIMNFHECVSSLQEAVDPPVGTIAWISNISVGIKKKASRKKLEAATLLYLAGGGLDAAMVDLLDPEIRKALYFIKSFRDEIVFSPALLD